MSNSKKFAKTIRMTTEVDQKFETAFQESNFDSKGEFIEYLIDKALNDEPTVEIEEVKVEVEKKLEPNQLLFTLTPAQMFALREYVTRSPEFVLNQNKIIDKLAVKPWWASSDLYIAELQELWVRNIEPSEKMEESEKEVVVKHNMCAYILNMFLFHIVEGNISDADVSAEDIRAFIQEQADNKKSEEYEITLLHK